MNMQTKTQQALDAFNSGHIKVAFRIMKSFSGFSKDELQAIQIAYECLSGKAPFYQSIGIDTEGMINKAILCVSERYHISQKLHQR